MINIIRYKNTTWIDIIKPTKEDIKYLKDNFKFHPVVLNEIIPPSYFPKVKNYRSYLFQVFYYPVYNKITRETDPRELDILVTKDTLITVHYQTILPLKALWDRCNLYDTEKKKYFTQGSGFLLFNLLSKIFDQCLLKLNRIDRRIEFIEKEIFQGRERKMVEEISIVKRDIIDFYRIIEPQKSIVESLVFEGEKFWGEEIVPYFSDLLSSFGLIWNQLKNYRETIEALQQTNDSLLTTKINDIIKVLTIFSVIVFPLTLLASIFGMNTKFLPFVGWPGDFWIILGIMFLGVIVMIIYFRKRRWI